MGSYLNLVLLSLAGVALVFVAFWLGWQIKPRVKNPILEETGPVETRLIDGSLPPDLKRYVEQNCGKTVPVPESLVAWGSGQILVRNPKPLGAIWAPLTWRMDLVPNESFVLDTRVTWFTRTFLLGGDEYRNGIGRFVAGGTVLQNDNINSSEELMMWLYSFFLSPASLLTDDRRTFTAVDEGKIQLSIPSVTETPLTFDLSFNTESGQLREIHTQRRTSKGGNYLPFHIRLSEYQPFSPGITLPGYLEATWEEETYLRLRISDVLYNVDVTEAMENGV